MYFLRDFVNLSYYNAAVCAESKPTLVMGFIFVRKVEFF